MRSADIKADGRTVYAFARSWDWKHDRAVPVVISATGLSRSYQSTSDGVRMHYLKDDMTPDGVRSGVVRSADIRELWETYKPRADENRRRQAAAKAEADAAHAASVARLDEVFATMRTERPEWTKGISRWGTLTSREQVTLDELADLLEAAYRAGVRGGSR